MAFYELVGQRFSQRVFTDKAVDEDLIDKLVRAGLMPRWVWAGMKITI